MSPAEGLALALALGLPLAAIVHGLRGATFTRTPDETERRLLRELGGTWDREQGRVHATVEDMRASVELGLGGEHHRELIVRVEVPRAGPDFELEQAGALRQLGRFLGLVQDPKLGDRRLDDRFRFEGDGAGVLSLFRDTPLEALMRDGGLRRLELRSGALCFRLWVPFEELRAAPQRVRHVVRVARACRRERAQVVVRGEAAPATHLVALGARSQPCCPYCRDALEGELHACPACDTVHHAECFDEHGGCTVLGCGGQAGRISA